MMVLSCYTLKLHETPKFLQLDGIWLLLSWSRMHFRASTVSGWRAVGTVLGPPCSRWTIVHMSESLWIQYDQYLDTVSISQFCNFSQFSLQTTWWKASTSHTPMSTSSAVNCFSLCKPVSHYSMVASYSAKVTTVTVCAVCVHLKLDQSHHSLEAFVCQPGLWSDENHPVMASKTISPSCSSANCFAMEHQLCQVHRFLDEVTKPCWTQIHRGVKWIADDIGWPTCPADPAVR